MDGLFTLLSLSTLMAIASFLAGILPLSFGFSQSRMRLISTIGMGVLVGTALIVIIPEGVETLYRADSIVQPTTGAAAQRNFGRFYDGGRRLTRRAYDDPADVEFDNYLSSPGSDYDLPGPVLTDSFAQPPKTPTEPGVVGVLAEDEGEELAEEGADTHDREKESRHAWIGIALIAGFILMFLIDKIPQYTSASGAKQTTHHIALNNLGQRFHLTTSLDQEEEAETFLENHQTAESRGKSFATTIGLVIHAAADGIALGASSSGVNSRLSLVIFFAIMVHKAPAAFGLTSILLRQGLSKRMARAHLVLFSLAAPAGAIVTWILARMLGAGTSSSAQNTQWWTGVLLLFSAGTFLYVAMHSMEEILGGREHDHGMNGHANGSLAGGADSSRSESHKPPIKDLAAAIFGMILPLFLQVGHAH